MRRTILLAVAAWLSLAATAGAQATPTATPNTPGKGSALTFDVDTTLPPVAGKVAKGLTFTAPGFRLDPTAVPKRCKPLQATLDECPAKSKVGGGTLAIQVDALGQLRVTEIPINFYLRSKKAVYAITKISVTRATPGTISTSGGAVSFAFTDLPDPPPFPNVSYALQRVTVKLGVTNKITKVVRKKGKKRKRTTTRRSFLTTPSSCDAGSWASTVGFGYADGSSEVVPTPMACAAR
jgi:hypothetical protein